MIVHPGNPTSGCEFVGGGSSDATGCSAGSSFRGSGGVSIGGDGCGGRGTTIGCASGGMTVGISAGGGVRCWKYSDVRSVGVIDSGTIVTGARLLAKLVWSL